MVARPMTLAVSLDGYTDLPPGKIANVVTCLEMDAAPPARPDPPNASLSLRREEAIELGIYRALFRRIGEPWLWFSRLVMSDAGLAGVLHDPAFEVYVLRREDEDIGLLELDFRVPGECEISFFGVVETAIGTGAARFMMNRALARAWSAPIGRMWVHTCTLDHPAALPFYQRSGFRPFKLQIEICDDPRLGGLLARDAGSRIALLPGTTT